MTTDDPKTGSDERPLFMGGSDEIGPITFKWLDFAIDEALSAMEGCLDLVEDMEDGNSRSAEFFAPLLMCRLTLEYGISQLFSVSPDGALPEVAE
jgi:hypothetical protein